MLSRKNRILPLAKHLSKKNIGFRNSTQISQLVAAHSGFLKGEVMKKSTWSDMIADEDDRFAKVRQAHERSG